MLLVLTDFLLRSLRSLHDMSNNSLPMILAIVALSRFKTQASRIGIFTRIDPQQANANINVLLSLTNPEAKTTLGYRMAPRLHECANRSHRYSRNLDPTLKLSQVHTHMGPHFLFHWFTRLDRKVSI